MRFFWLCCLLAVGTFSCSLPTEQQAGSTIRIRWTRDPESLSPIGPPNQNAFDAINLLHCGLLQQDFSTNSNSPALADSMPRVRLLGDSLLQLRYQLRAAATWDDGRPVLATDVAFTLKLMRCPGLPNEMYRAQFGFIRAIVLDARNPRCFTLLCRGQSPSYSKLSGDFPVLPEAALDPAHTLRRFSLAALTQAKAPAELQPLAEALAKRYEQADPGHHPDRLPGCGAYRLTDWETGHSLTFTRKQRWWADALSPTPFVLQARSPRLQFIILPDDAAAGLALRRHALDVLPQVSAREFRRLQASSARAELAFYATTSYEIVIAGFNTRRPMLHDSLTRQALGRLFDPARLLQATQLGQGMLTVGLVHPTDHRYYNDSLAPLAYSPVQAQALLRRAGWQHQSTGWVRPTASRGPEQLALTVRYRAGETTFETVALQFKAAAAALAIPVQLRPTEASALTTAIHKGDFDIVVRTTKGTPLSFNYGPILHSLTVNEGNFTKFSNRANDRLIEAIAAASTPHDKRLLLRRFQVLLREQAPIVPLFFLPYRIATAKRLEHLYPSGIKPGYAAAAMTWRPATPATPPAH